MELNQLGGLKQLCLACSKSYDFVGDGYGTKNYFLKVPFYALFCFKALSTALYLVDISLHFAKPLWYNFGVT